MSDETPLECLSRLGTNSMLWAQEFNKTAVRLGYSEMDEEWLAGWFANAIENCDVIRCNPLRAENEKLRKALKPFADAVLKDEYSWKYDINSDDFRAAAAALRESGDE